MNKLTTTDKILLYILIALKWLCGDLFAIDPVGLRLQKVSFWVLGMKKFLILIDSMLQADKYLPIMSMKVGNALLYPEYIF